MTVLENRSELEVAEYETGFGEAELNVERTDIAFHDVAGGKVRIQVTARNTGTHSSPPAPMRLESAPLGAFLPWADWTTVLYEATNNKNLLANPSDTPIEDSQWLEAQGSLMVMLATQPPADCKAGKLEVHVTRRSLGETAIVEFDLDSGAEGAGCYYV